MTVTHRKPQQLDELQAAAEPDQQFHCDSCTCDLTHSVRIKCADPICEPGDGVDLCPTCFCAGKEFGQHKAGHAYRIVELHSYPIFHEDWGADEELLMLSGIAAQGLGNWKKVADHIGTRTRDEVEEHYNSVYINSPNWPLPVMDRQFDIDPAEFHERKRRRIAKMNAAAPPPAKPAPTSAPGIHEVATFLPGRLEFEHELDNDAEDLVKDLEFGMCMEYGGDQIAEDEHDLDVKARQKWAEERQAAATSGKGPMKGIVNGTVNGYHLHGDVVKRESQSQSQSQSKSEEDNANGNGEDDGADEVTQPPPIETPDSLTFKLTLLEMYAQRVEKRLEAKAIMFDRGLLEYKKMAAAEKKRPREEKELVHRLKPFAKLQTAEDFEVFTTDILYEAMLRKQIQELQSYRRLGLQTVADIDKYQVDLNNRRSQPKGSRDVPGRKSHERDFTPKPAVRRPPAPLNIANSPCLHLLTPGEQTLCSSLRILPKPYLVIKETLVREYARRGGKLRRREARDLVKIDVNKTSRVWDFLVQTGFLKITAEPAAPAASAAQAPPDSTTGGATSSALPPSTSGSPLKDQAAKSSPRLPTLPPPPLNYQATMPTQNGFTFQHPLPQAQTTAWTPH
ncbi:Transcriptional adapter 2 [Pleurotus pulmonarius]